MSISLAWQYSVPNAKYYGASLSDSPYALPVTRSHPELGAYLHRLHTCTQVHVCRVSIIAQIVHTDSIIPPDFKLQ